LEFVSLKGMEFAKIEKRKTMLYRDLGIKEYFNNIDIITASVL